MALAVMSLHRRAVMSNSARFTIGSGHDEQQRTLHRRLAVMSNSARFTIRIGHDQQQHTLHLWQTYAYGHTIPKPQYKCMYILVPGFGSVHAL